jgi:hypothetical protein
MMNTQEEFDLVIGRLDYCLSHMVMWGKDKSLRQYNKQTLKHHAEDMIAAGDNILTNLGDMSNDSTRIE